MTPEQYSALNDLKPAPPLVITAEHLTDKTPRTLLWGYTLERESWHVYLGGDGKIHTVTYPMRDDEPEEVEIHSSERYVPSKRLYPEACDLEFCVLLKNADIYLPFTTFSNNREPAQYYGKILN